jgi:hypothetical protein
MSLPHLRAGGPARRLLFTLLLFGGPATAADEHLFSVHLEGRKIGHMQTVRTVDGERVRTERRLELSLERSGEPLHVRSSELSEETLDGIPLRFASESDLAGSSARSDGRIVDGDVVVERRQAGQAAILQRYPWPAGALLAEGQRLAAARHPLEPDTRFTLDTFDPASQRSQKIEWQIIGTETIDVHGAPEAAVRVRQLVDAGSGNGLEFDTWLRADDRAVRRLRVPALGLLLEMQACDQACALAPLQPTDVLAATLVPAPRTLRARDRKARLSYRLALDARQAQGLHDLPGQTLRPGPGGTQLLTVDPAGSAALPPTADDLAATRWLQSDAEEIQALATTTVRGLVGERARMLALEQAVRRHIATKSLRIGYASALEALHLREGDCTEHAVLLAALARAIGIPARVATGLSYTANFGGRRHVFVPHAWVFAWIDGRWQGFDAALAGHGSSHIAFSADHGDPFRFHRGLELLGRMQIDSIERLPGQRGGDRPAPIEAGGK